MNTQDDHIHAIHKLANDWSDAWNRSDVDGLLSLVTDDVILLPQGQPAITGKETIRSIYESLFKEYSVKGNGRVVEVEVSGDLGYYWSMYTLIATPNAGGDSVRSEGKSLFIVKRQNDNSWKIVRLMDNSDRES